MKSVRFLLGVCPFVCAVLFFSCSRSESPLKSESLSRSESRPGSAAAVPEMKKDFAFNEVSSDSPPSSPSAKPAGDAKTGRKLVYNASMILEVQDMKTSEELVTKAVEKTGGYVESRSGDNYAVYLVFRVPSDALESSMAETAQAGKTLSASMTADDVTDRFFDLEGRLRNMRILEERYRSYLKQAKTIEDILMVEKSLSDTTLEIENLEGSFRDLSKQISLSSLTVTLQAERSDDPSRPGFLKMVRNLFSSFGEVMTSALVVILGLFLYGIPLLLFLALVWFAAFGRLGLVRRLFDLVKEGRKRE